MKERFRHKAGIHTSASLELQFTGMTAAIKHVLVRVASGGPPLRFCFGFDGHESWEKMTKSTFSKFSLDDGDLGTYYTK